MRYLGYQVFLLLISSCIPSNNVWDKWKLHHYARHADEIRALGDSAVSFSRLSKQRYFSFDTSGDKTLKRRFKKVGFAGHSIEVTDSTVTFDRLYLRGDAYLVYVFSKNSWDTATHKDYIKVADNLYYLHVDIHLM